VIVVDVHGACLFIANQQQQATGNSNTAICDLRCDSDGGKKRKWRNADGAQRGAPVLVWRCRRLSLSSSACRRRCVTARGSAADGAEECNGTCALRAIHVQRESVAFAFSVRRAFNPHFSL
jgi:hypothetical protein